jgi:hypothetical protein
MLTRFGCGQQPWKAYSSRHTASPQIDRTSCHKTSEKREEEVLRIVSFEPEITPVVHTCSISGLATGPLFTHEAATCFQVQLYCMVDSIPRQPQISFSHTLYFLGYTSANMSPKTFIVTGASRGKDQFNPLLRSAIQLESVKPDSFYPRSRHRSRSL